MHNEDRFNFSYRFAENSDVKDLRKLEEKPWMMLKMV